MARAEQALPEEQGPKGGEKVLLPRRVDWLRGQRGLRELMVPTFPGGVTDCSSWVGLMNVGPTFVSGASGRKKGPTQKIDKSSPSEVSRVKAP